MPPSWISILVGRKSTHWLYDEVELLAEREGSYGRELIERALPYQLKARTSY